MNKEQMNVSTGIVATGAPLALRGYDPVTYLTEKAPRPGSAKHSLVHNGAAYYFASEADASTFKANPEKYLPSFGGFCAYGVSVGKKFDGDPLIYKIEGGRLHLNLNQEIHQAFLKDVPGAVAKADQQWKTIGSKPVSEL